MGSILDTTAIVASSFRTMRDFVPFPELPHIEVTQLELARHDLAQVFIQKWDGNHKGRICSSTVVAESHWILTACAVFELGIEYR